MHTIQLTLAVALSACVGSKPESAEQPPAEPMAAEKYAIKIHRPFTVGQVIAVDVEAHHTSKAAVEGKEHELGSAGQIDFHLVGDVTIDEVAPDGRAAAATLKVTTFINPADKTVILPPDAVVHAKRVDGVLEPVLDRGTLTAHQKWFLQLAFPLERPGSRLGDELFGTPEPRAVGETWPFNHTYVVEDLRDEGFGASETGIGGVVKLQEILPCGKTRCLKLQIDVKAENAALLTVDGTSNVGAGELLSTIVLEVPVDETTPIHLEDATTTLTHAATYTEGGQTNQRMITTSRHRRATYVPKE
jgi:hypothetical protein